MERRAPQLLGAEAAPVAGHQFKPRRFGNRLGQCGKHFCLRPAPHFRCGHLPGPNRAVRVEGIGLHDADVDLLDLRVSVDQEEGIVEELRVALDLDHHASAVLVVTQPGIGAGDRREVQRAIAKRMVLGDAVGLDQFDDWGPTLRCFRPHALDLVQIDLHAGCNLAIDFNAADLLAHQLPGVAGPCEAQGRKFVGRGAAGLVLGCFVRFHPGSAGQAHRAGAIHPALGAGSANGGMGRGQVKHAKSPRFTSVARRASGPVYKLHIPPAWPT